MAYNLIDSLQWIYQDSLFKWLILILLFPMDLSLGFLVFLNKCTCLLTLFIFIIINCILSLFSTDCLSWLFWLCVVLTTASCLTPVRIRYSGHLLEYFHNSELPFTFLNLIFFCMLSFAHHYLQFYENISLAASLDITSRWDYIVLFAQNTESFHSCAWRQKTSS